MSGMGSADSTPIDPVLAGASSKAWGRSGLSAESATGLPSMRETRERGFCALGGRARKRKSLEMRPALLFLLWLFLRDASALGTTSPLLSLRGALGTASLRDKNTNPAQMRARYDDGDERRLSKGGSGGRFQASSKRLGISRTEKYSNPIRQKKLEEYVNSDLEAADPLIGKIIAGSALLTIFGLLFAVYAYYGADGLAAATQTQRNIRGI